MPFVSFSSSTTAPAKRTGLPHYFNAINSESLINANVEFALGEKIQSGAAAQKAKDESGATAELDKSIEEGRKAHDKLVRANLRLVLHIARRYKNVSRFRADLIQSGNMGLIEAAWRYDPSKGYRFATYANHWIRQGITKFIFDKSRTIRVPVYLWAWKTKQDKIIASFNRSGKPFTDDDVRVAMGLSESQYKGFSKAFPVLISSDAQLPFTSQHSASVARANTAMGTTLADSQKLSFGADGGMDNAWDMPAPEQFAWNCFVSNTAKDILGVLSCHNPQWADIVESRHPLDGSDPATYKSIGERYGKSDSWAVHCYKKAVNWLKENTDGAAIALGE